MLSKMNLLITRKSLVLINKINKRQSKAFWPNYLLKMKSLMINLFCKQINQMYVKLILVLNIRADLIISLVF